MRSAPFPWVILAAWAILWFAPQINRWLDRPPSRPDPWRSMHNTPTQVHIIRPNPSRELERGDASDRH
jgi:hypothetical protein